MLFWKENNLHLRVETQDFLNMKFAREYEIWELLRHKKIPETHILATLLTGNAWLGGVDGTGLMANLC